jgi:hypothetical protein
MKDDRAIATAPRTAPASCGQIAGMQRGKPHGKMCER